MTPSSPFSRWAIPLLLLTCASTIAINHLFLTWTPVAYPAAYRTPAWLQRHLTLGYDKCLAVLYWFDVISNFGGKLADEADYSLLAEKLDTITTLNPHAGYAYYTAATALTWQLHSTRLSGPLLERGIRAMPEEWAWPYYRGFYSYFFDHDTKTAAKYLAIAAKHPNVPPILVRLAAKMRAQHAGLDTALAFLQQMLKKKQDPALRKKIEREIKRIRTEQVLRALDRIIAKIPNWHGDIQQLQRLGVHLPNTLPDGGHVIFNAQHKPVSSVEKDKRYQLFQSAAYRRTLQ